MSMRAFTEYEIGNTPAAQDCQQASPQVASPVSAEPTRVQAMRVAASAVGRGWTAIATLVAWAVCVGPPAARYAARWLFHAGRTVRGQARRAAQRSVGDGVRRGQDAAAASLGSRASYQTRDRWLALSALAVVSGAMLVIILSNLSASAGGTQRLAAHRRGIRLARPSVAGRTRGGRTASAVSTTK